METKVAANKLGISLWENAYDSIEHGLEHLELAVDKDNAYDYKRAVLDFCHAAELLLKEILFRIDPIYAFDKNDLFKKCKDPLHPTLNELYTCKSLEVAPLCDAIAKYATGFMQTQRVNLNVFRSEASKLRNKIQHFCYESTITEVRSILMKLSYQLLCPAFTYLDIDYYDPLSKRLYRALHLQDVIDYHIKELSDNDPSISSFEVGNCFSCGYYSLLIIFNDNKTGYPVSCRCVACDYSKKDIVLDEYRECPECSANSLIYAEEFDGGMCLNYKCANHRDGGILINMELCEECDDYKIEGKCECNQDDED